MHTKVAAVCRAVAMQWVAAGRGQGKDEEEEDGQEGMATSRVVVGPEQLEEMLGPVRYESEIAARLSMPGVVTGLAWKVSGSVGRLVGGLVGIGQAGRQGWRDGTGRGEEEPSRLTSDLGMHRRPQRRQHQTTTTSQATGGELLFIECSLVPGGRGALTITGKLGEVRFLLHPSTKREGMG